MALTVLARTLDRGLRASVAMLVLAIAGAVLFPQSQGERLATAAYLAAIYAAIMFVALRCVPQSERLRANQSERSVAGTVAFWILVGCALAVSASVADSLFAEILVAVGCTVVVALAPIVPPDLLTLVRRELLRGGLAMAIARYAVLASLAGWALATYAHTDSPTAAVFGFALGVIACIVELATSRPIGDIIGATSSATIVAFGVAACVPAFAEVAAAVGYAAAVFTMGLLVLRAHYA